MGNRQIALRTNEMPGSGQLVTRVYLGFDGIEATTRVILLNCAKK